MSIPKGTMSLPETMKVTGTVAGAGATTVLLYQYSGTRWVHWTSAKVVAGRYSVTYKPVSAGGHAIRVTTPKTTRHAAGTSAKKYVTVYRWQYLSNWADTPRQVAQSAWYSLDRVANINGRVYLHSPVDVHDSLGQTGSVEYNLSRGCLTFRMAAGVTDESPSGGSAQLEIQTDTVPIWAQTMTLGQNQDVSLNVNGSLRLRLQDTIVSDLSGWDYIYAAFGNARVLCRF
jgi:hypothetical protein